MKYIDAEKLIAEIKGFRNLARERVDDEDTYFLGMAQGYDNSISIIASLQQEYEIVELSFKGGTYRVNGEEHAFKGGKAKVIILEINQEEE